MTNPKIVIIGGGTGSFAVLSSLKNYSCSITSLVNMVDNGGSTGLLRDEFGVLPPGDIRQCLVALSQAPQQLRDLFNFRFPGDGDLAGHSFGNLFLSAVEMMTDNFSESIKLASKILDIRGNVFPVTLDKCELILRYDGHEIRGERMASLTTIDHRKEPEFYLSPEAKLNPEAEKAIQNADLVVIAPGNLYASLVPSFLVSGMKQALKNTKAKLIYVCNLVNKNNHTDGYTLEDYVSEIEKYIGEGAIDIVLYNTDLPSEELLDKYALEGEYPVKTIAKTGFKPSYTVINGNFLSRGQKERDHKDIFNKRSLIRHDGDSISRAIVSCIE